MSGFVQILMGTLGTFGFNILFNIRGRKLLFATLGGLISWAVSWHWSRCCLLKRCGISFPPL